MKLEPGTNRDIVWQALKKPMTIKEVKSILPREISYISTVIAQLHKAGWVKKVGDDKWVANKKRDPEKIPEPKPRSSRNDPRPALLEFFRNNIGVEFTRQEITSGSGVSSNTSTFYKHTNKFIKDGILGVRKVGHNRLYTALPSIKSNGALSEKKGKNKTKEFKKGAGAVPKIRPLIIDFFNNNLKQEYTIQEIIKAIGISPKSSGPSCHLKEMTENGILTVHKDGHRKLYSAPSRIKTNNTLPVKSQQRAPVTRKTKPLSQEVRGQVIPPPLIIPGLDGLADNNAMDIGAMVNQIVAVNQQNLLYRHAFEGIMHIFEQLKLLEAED